MWSDHDFPCFGCSNSNCTDGIRANLDYGLNDLNFENGKKLGEGGFSKVFEYKYHDEKAAYKKIPIIVGNDKKKAL